MDWLNRKVSFKISSENVANLIRTAQLYEIAELEQDVERFFMDQLRPTPDLFVVALKYDLRYYLEKYDAWLYARFSDILEAGLIHHLSHDQVRQL